MGSVLLSDEMAARLALAAADESTRRAVVALATNDAALLAEAQLLMDNAQTAYGAATGKRLPHGVDCDGLPQREALYAALATGVLPARPLNIEEGS